MSSANLSGEPAATDADEAERMLGESVRVHLYGGPTAGALPSTIVDCTGEQGRLLRSGVVPLATLNEIVAPLETSIADGAAGG